MELSIWVTEETCRGFLVNNTGVTSFPFPHHMNGVGIAGKTERVSAECRTKINGYHDKVT